MEKRDVRRSRRMRGFTLIELLVVLVILGLLAGLVGPRVISYLGGAKSDSARQQIGLLEQALDLYRLDVGRYPTTEEGLQALVQKPANAERWNGPYLKKNQVPKDPWGNDYIYQSPGEHDAYDIASLGANRAEGGEGEDTDIVSWQ
jgi:general secretion pathway protein G